MNPLQGVIAALSGRQFKPTVILLVSPVILLCWKYFASVEFFAGHSLVDGVDPRAFGAICHFISCFVLMAVLPALIVKWVFHDRLSDYGVGLGVRKWTVRSFAVLAPLFLLVSYLASSDPAMLAKFPIDPSAGQSPRMFAIHTASYFLFYIGWEFYFRGFMLFGLRETYGGVHAVLIQVLASALLHIGSPASETFGAILGGLLWGWLALQSRSLASGFGQHFILGIALDAFICFG